MKLRIQLFFFLCIFLGVRLFYRLKLLRFSIKYSWMRVELNFWGIIGVLLIVSLIIVVVNLFLRLIIRVRLEVVRVKLRIYLVVLFFGLLSGVWKIYNSLVVYDWRMLTQEIWVWDWYKFDKIVYNWIISCVNGLGVLTRVKRGLVFNWWVVLGVILLYYK